MISERRPILLLLNGNIRTMDDAQRHASALAIDRGSGRILAVGDDADIRALAGPLTDTLDLGGRTALPGFTDAHTHLLGYAESRLEVDLHGAVSEDEAVARVRERAAITPEGAWVRGHGWQKNTWPGDQFPTRASLDAAVPRHPVALSSYDHHSLWVNSEALRRAGITAMTPQPGSGQIAHDGAGEPTGMLFESEAMDLIYRVMQPPDDNLLTAELRRVLVELTARGVTGVHNIEDARSLRMFQRLHAEGAPRPRMLFYIWRTALEDAVKLGLEAGFGDDYLRFAGIKVFMDGALTSQTAALLDPYEGQPDNRGLLTTDEQEIVQIAREAAGGRLGVAIHAIGDRAVHTALDGIEAVLREHADDPGGAPVAARRFRLEHVQLATPDDIARIARLGIPASVQPFHAVADRYTASRVWGQRAQRSYAYRTLRDAGIALALGSDVPVDTPDPLRIIHAAVTRRNDASDDPTAFTPDQALTVAQALHAYTLGSARAAGREGHQGTLAPGKLADLAIFAEDPYTIPPEKLATLEVAATLIGGELVHGQLE